MKTSGAARYLPVAYFVVSLALVASLLPTALRPPPQSPPSAAQLSPDSPPDENTEVVLSTIGRGSSRTAGAGHAVETVTEAVKEVVTRPRSGSCFGEPARQVESVYAPPCVPAFVGDNGGATWRGVSRTEIRIAMPGDSQFTGPVPDNPSPGENTAQRTRRVYQAYFNQNFELYGRRLRFYVIPSSSDPAAVVQADEEFKVFGILNLLWDAEAEALRRKLVYWGAIHNTKEFFREHAPYAWSFLQDGTSDLVMSAELMCKQLAGKPVSFSGDPSMQGTPRKLGAIFYYHPNHPNAAGTTEDALRRQCGASFTEKIIYGLVNDQQEIATGISKLRVAGVTTIFCWCDWITTATWTRMATDQAYFPEWMTQGGNTKDQNDNGRLYDQTQWKNSVHISASEIPRPNAERDHYRAYKSIDPDNEPSNEPFQGGLFHQLLQFVGGIQLAGPKLTPDTFREGMFRRWPHRPPDPPWTIGGGYGTDDYTYPDYVGLLWWDPNAPDPISSGSTGAYRWVYNGKRFTFGEIPSEPVPFFKEGITRAPPR